MDTDNNGDDFTAGAPSPRNTVSTIHPCPTDTAPAVASTSPSNGAGGVAAGANITVTFNEPVNVSGSWFSLSCTSSGSHTAAVSGGPTTFTLDPDTDFAEGESCNVAIFAANVADQDTTDPPDNMDADYAFGFATIMPALAIHTVQGANHLSPYAGQTVRVLGIVTARTSNGFWMQDPNPDADDATSEGIFVFTSSVPSAAATVGNQVSTTGRAQEFRPGGATTGNLTTTELTSPTISVLSTGNPLPAPVVIGNGGRVPPDTVIEDDAVGGSVENAGSVFDPSHDGLDFYESLEGMRVQLNDAVAVGPTATAFGETPVVGDDGANASVRTYRGGLLLRPGDGNPERITLDDLTPVQPANVGDHYYGAIVGVVDYNFGNPFLEVTSAPDVTHNGVQREATAPVSAGELAISTFNFENLAATDPQSKFDGLANLIVNNLRAPDLLAGEEVQDNDGVGGPLGNTEVDASQTLTRLVNAISAAGGPTYDWRQIDPVYNQDGGAPNGNIRQVILFRTDRGLSFVDRTGAGSTTPNAVTGSGASTQLLYSPGRIDAGRLCVERLPQAAGGRAHVPRPPPVRDRQPLQLEGRRRPASRPLPAAERGDRDAAAPAGHTRGGLRLADLVGRPGRERRRPRRPERLRVLADGPDPRGRGPPRPDEHPPAERALQLRVRGQRPGARPHHVQRAAVLTAVLLRPGARERGVLRPGLRPRPVRGARPPERRPLGGRGWAVCRGRGLVGGADRERERPRGRPAHVRMGSRRQRFVRDPGPVGLVLWRRRAVQPDCEGARDRRRWGLRRRAGNGERREPRADDRFAGREPVECVGGPAGDLHRLRDRPVRGRPGGQLHVVVRHRVGLRLVRCKPVHDVILGVRDVHGVREGAGQGRRRL